MVQYLLFVFPSLVPFRWAAPLARDNRTLIAVGPHLSFPWRSDRTRTRAAWIPFSPFPSSYFPFTLDVIFSLAVLAACGDLARIPLPFLHPFSLPFSCPNPSFLCGEFPFLFDLYPSTRPKLFSPPRFARQGQWVSSFLFIF